MFKGHRIKVSIQTFLVPFLFLFISSIQANGLYLKPRTIIEKYPIKLSDVARLHKDIKDRVLFDSLEDIKILTIDELKDSINDPNISFYGKECLIIPLNKKYSKEEILESLEKEFFSKLGIQSTEAKIHYLGEEETFPSSGVELRWNNLPKRLTPGQKIFSLDFYVEREKIYSKKLKFLVETPLTALVASHDIARNAKLTKSDFMTKTFFSADAIADGFNHDITGYTAIVAIAEGSVIRKKQVREIHLVEKGMEVDIVFMKGSLFVRGKGVAKNSANEGELVKVVNSSSNHTVSGRAMDKGVVVIE